jgi:hypothetical protein
LDKEEYHDLYSFTEYYDVPIKENNMGGVWWMRHASKFYLDNLKRRDNYLGIDARVILKRILEK